MHTPDQGKTRDSFLKRWGFRILRILAIKPEEWTRAEAFTAVLSFFLCISSAKVGAEWWKWSQGQVGLYVPILWIVAPIVIIKLAPEWRLVVIGALGFWVFFGLKSAILDNYLPGLLIAIASAALGLIWLVLEPTKFNEAFGRINPHRKK